MSSLLGPRALAAGGWASLLLSAQVAFADPPRPMVRAPAPPPVVRAPPVAPARPIAAPPAAPPAAASPAKAPTNHRLHVLTPELTKRLDPEAQSNVAATARWRDSATAFLVFRRPTPGGPDRALLLTNEHVAGHRDLAAGPGQTVTFPEGAQARTVRILASSRKLDYALVEVELPAETRAAPVRLRLDQPKAGEGVYAVSGFANIDIPGGPEKGVAVNPANRAIVEAALKEDKRYMRSLPTIQLGNVETGIPKTIRVPHPITIVASDLPNRPGASGSPVISRTDHRVVALHSSGDPRVRPWTSSEVPIHMILDHVTSELKAGRIPEDAHDLTRGLLETTRPPAPAAP